MILPVVLGLTAVLTLLAPVLDRRFGREACWPLAAGLLALGLWLALAAPADASFAAAWLPTIDVSLRLRLDGLSLLFALLVLVVGAIVLAYSARYLGPGRHPGFAFLMTLFAAAMLGLVLADDVILLFVMWETTTFCSFFLIARSGEQARDPAVRTVLVTAAGGLSLLAAVVAMAVQTGTTQLSVILTDPVWSQDPVFAGWIALLVAVAAFTKSAQFPFHAWLPDAMVASTPVSAYLHAAAMVKAGIYLLMRFTEAFAEVPVWNAALIGVGLLTAAMGAVFALQRHDLKELLAYSTISQLGFLVATIGIGTPTALVAAAVHTVAHALFKSSLFMLVGVIDNQTGTRDIRELSGLRHTMPVTSLAVLLAALSMAGVPPLLGFISKESLFKALLEAPGPAWAGPVAGTVAVLAAIATFGYAARIVLGALAGPAHDTDVNEARPAFLLPAALPAAAGAVLGLVAAALDPLVAGAAEGATGVHEEADLALWHGVSPELAMSGAVIVGGVLLVLVRHRVDRLLDRPLVPGSGVQAVAAWQRGTIAMGGRVGAVTGSDAPAAHLGIPAVGLTLLAVLGVVVLDLPTPVPGLTAPTDWLLLGIVGIGVLGAVRARTRLAAVIVIGVVGFAVSLWFYSLGAVDVALTQLLVEVLTVVVMVLLLRRLPDRFRTVSRGRTIVTATVAVATGLAAALAVYAFTGRRGPSPANEFYVEQGEEITGGTNIVNTILVEFRALDTLGELTVLGVAGVAIVALLRSRALLSARPARLAVRSGSPLLDAADNAVFVRSLARFVGPLMVVVSLVLLWRGHNEPGGGFISALVGGAGFALLWLTASSDSTARVRMPYLLLIGAGVVVGVATGLTGLVAGSFLEPLHTEVFGIFLTTALVFDVGVYLAVIGVVLTALNQLGVSPPSEADPPRAADDEVAAGEEVR